VLNGASQAKPGSAAAKRGRSDPKGVRDKVAKVEHKPPAVRDEFVAVTRTGGRNGKVSPPPREKLDAVAQQPDSPRAKGAARKAAAPKPVARPDAGSIEQAKLQQLVSEISGRVKPVMPRQVAKPKVLARRPAPAPRNAKALAAP
jgi:hypothetical protein